MKRRKEFLYWVLAIMLSFVFVCAIGFKWFQVRRIQGHEVNVVKDKSDLETLLKRSNTTGAITLKMKNWGPLKMAPFFIQ